jgi:hypothetical protein
MDDRADRESKGAVSRRMLALWRLVFVVAFHVGMPCGLMVTMSENFVDFPDALDQLVRIGSIVSLILAAPCLLLAYFIARRQTPTQAAPIWNFTAPFFWVTPITLTWLFATLCVLLREPDIIFAHGRPSFINHPAIDVAASGWWMLLALVIVGARWFYVGESTRWEPLEALH